METLHKITKMEMLRFPHFNLDQFQKEVLNNIYLEFFLAKCRVLITPEMQYLTTGEAGEDEKAALEEILMMHAETIIKLRDYLMYNLSLYSALLETNSYYIGLNRNLLISRFVPLKDHPDEMEVKLYTLSKEDIIERYKDKIYLGRDFISLRTIRREQFGLKHLKNSLIDQFLKLKDRIAKLVPPELLKELSHEYLLEAEELIGEFAENSAKILEQYPADISTQTMEAQSMTEVNSKFRELKHILIELEDSIREMEIRMFESDLSKAVRYVTKFRKDITNYVNYIMFKVNGRISDSINGIHV